MSGEKRVLNYRFQPKDERDIRIREFTPFLKAAVAIPSSVDLTDECSSVYDQGELGSCTANALAGCMEFRAMEQNHGALPRNFSRLGLYWDERRAMGLFYVRQDSGSYLRTGIKVMARNGVGDEQLWPYDVSKFRNKPSLAYYADASRWQVTEYANLAGATNQETLHNLRESLARGYPFAFGVMVYDSFMASKDGIIPLPNLKAEVCHGGHAIMAVGYDDATETILFRNSWGTAWGKNGYGTLPYAYFLAPDLASDFQVIHAQEKGADGGIKSTVAGVYNWLSYHHIKGSEVER